MRELLRLLRICKHLNRNCSNLPPWGFVTLTSFRPSSTFISVIDGCSELHEYFFMLGRERRESVSYAAESLCSMAANISSGWIGLGM